MVASDLSATPLCPAESPRSASGGEAHLLLEITRGRTRFPLRPVRGPRFLIGAAVTCDLRLGGEGMPALHSLITSEDEVCEMEAIAAQPPLRVNGQVVHSVRLKDGDIIEIGEVGLTARMVVGRRPSEPEPASFAESEDQPLCELSAAELIDLIELEQSEIQRYEEGRRAGAAALLADIRRRQSPAPEVARVDVEAAPPPGPHFAAANAAPCESAAPSERGAGSPIDPSHDDDLAELGEQLAALSEELKASLAGVDEREEHYAQSLTQLLEMQQRLVQQLTAVTESVNRLQDQQEHSPFESSRPRAIA